MTHSIEGERLDCKRLLLSRVVFFIGFYPPREQDTYKVHVRIADRSKTSAIKT